MDLKNYFKKIFKPDAIHNFPDIAINVFNYQYNNNEVYRKYCELIKISPGNVKCITDIPYLPVEFFKNHVVISGNKKFEHSFYSSGTTKTGKSTHYVKDIELYKKSFLSNFTYFYGDLRKKTILALLPSYNYSDISSLIYMVKGLMDVSGSNYSAFYYGDYFDKLQKQIKICESENIKYYLIGVSHALLDFAEKNSTELKNAVVIETGGMKGFRKEIIREELHETLKKSFSLPKISSEYGMTELLSQSYSISEGIFECPPQMRVLIRDLNDPLDVRETGKGGINIIDLANIHSCSFIAVSDVGEVFNNKKFTVQGRVDNSELRGCNLLVV